MTDLIEMMKERIPHHEPLKKIMDELMETGLTEDEAIYIMFSAWREGMR